MYNQPLRPTQPPTLNGAGNEYRLRSVLYGREGNRRSGITLVMLHRLRDTTTYELSGLMMGQEHPAYIPLKSMVPLIFIPAKAREYVFTFYHYHFYYKSGTTT